MSLTKVKKSVLDISSFIGGANGQVQFNDSDDFGLDTNFTYNPTTHVLSVSGIDLAGSLGITGSLTVGTGGVIFPVGAYQSTLNHLVGMVAPFPIAAAPTGWLACDGSSILVANYPALHSIIGYTYGGATTNFSLPDYRGYFLRGQDDGSGNDPDAGTRTDRGDGTGGDNVGSKQLDAYKAHTHGGVPAKAGANTGAAGSAILPSTAGNTNSAGGNETRPKNINVLYCIKY